MMKIRCAIVGATGYTGLELASILLRHKKIELTVLTTRQRKAIPLRKLTPSLSKRIKLKITPYSFHEVLEKADVVFLCLPHTEAAATGARFRKAKKIVIDLSADFRLKNSGDYLKWYGYQHLHKRFLKEAVYGLPEMFREKIKRANLIANPGCYPTCAILGVAPLLAAKLVDSKSIVIDAKSGTTGAGRNAKPPASTCEEESNFYAYKVGQHQHTPEIEQALKTSVTFVAHLLPVKRGILSTLYLKKKKGVTVAQIKKAYKKAYDREPFVRVKSKGVLPMLKDVRHTNYCDIGFVSKPHSDQLIVISAIDNLVKGAAGQAVQNMNIRCGFSEKEGL